MSEVKNHDYHIVNPSVWPFVGAVSAFTMLFGMVMYFAGNGLLLALLGLLGVLGTMYMWWAEVVRESRHGDHTPVVHIGLRLGFILFVISEVMFFVAWFWAFFRYALFPQPATDSFEAGGAFPPQGVEAFDPFGLPLVNTLVLLLSGCTLTAAHHFLLDMREGKRDPIREKVVWLLAITCVLGAFFLVLQALEYKHAYHVGLTLDNTFYGATFFMATGFHGMHVLVGTIFLIVCLIRATRGHFSAEKHIGFEAAAWYWHFVDVVWLFLFAAIYIGSVSFFAVGA